MDVLATVRKLTTQLRDFQLCNGNARCKVVRVQLALNPKQTGRIRKAFTGRPIFPAPSLYTCLPRR
jgi:hypothetical protein